jgi:hypothetical protein
MLNSQDALRIVGSLRVGIPPSKGVSAYSVGNDKLIQGIQRFHLNNIENLGIIRFISGSWGSGKTHFFRLFREISFQNNCLVSNVQLNADDAALNRFERVFSSIIRNITTPSCLDLETSSEISPFSQVLKEALIYLSKGQKLSSGIVSYEDFASAREKLMLDHGIDIDFKKMIEKYWETFLPESPDISLQEQRRAEILQWFSGEGTISNYRRNFGVAKVVDKTNAKLMLQSLASFVKLAGYRGLVILFDEAEQAYSVMRKSHLKDAHNNLLSLINNIESLPGMFMIYATTPDFYIDPRHGIIIYGALATRIGKPESKKPKALDKIWNFDEVAADLEQYQEAAIKILGIYTCAFSAEPCELPTEKDVRNFVGNLNSQHSALSGVRFWRVMVAALISYLDDYLEGDNREASEIYISVMDRLREE